MWLNMFVQFEVSPNEKMWFYLSEHVNKLAELKISTKFIDKLYKPGDKVDLHYKIVQCKNKSTKLSIVKIENHQPKK